MVEPSEACQSHLTPLHPLGPNPPCPLMREGDMGGNCLGPCSDASFAVHPLTFWHNVKKAELGSCPTLTVLLTLEISASSVWLLRSSWLPSFSLSTSGSTSLSSKLYRIQKAMRSGYFQKFSVIMRVTPSTWSTWSPNSSRVSSWWKVWLSSCG